MKFTRVILMSITLLFSHYSSAVLSPAHSDLYDVGDGDGVVNFFGGVVVSPCILSSVSQDQFIDMGDVTARNFHRVGDNSRKVIFVVRMEDCLAGASESHADFPGHSSGRAARSYTTGEQAISLTFSGEQDAANPDLLMIHGNVKGLGLRLFDSQGKPLAMNSVQHPYLLSPGGNTLTFMASLESTQRDVGAGHYRGMVRLMMDYL